LSTIPQVEVLPRTTAAPNRLELSSVFALSAAALGVQVVWTRIFSFGFGVVLLVGAATYLVAAIASRRAERWSII
jgi:hypothetical protein